MSVETGGFNPERGKIIDITKYGDRFLQPHINEALNTPELKNTFSPWFKERIREAPEVTVLGDPVPQRGWKKECKVNEIPIQSLPPELQNQSGLRQYNETNAAGTQKTVYIYESGGQKKAIEILMGADKGSHFSTEGRIVKKTKNGQVEQEWWQPVIEQNTESVQLRNKEGQIVTVDASGYTGLIIDKQGRMLLGYSDELGADTDKRILMGPTIQTSIKKLHQIANEEITTDAFSEVLKEVVPQGKKFQDLLVDPGGNVKIKVLPAANPDGKRLHSQNIALLMSPSDEVINKLVAQKKFYLATPQEALALSRANLLNGHVNDLVLKHIAENFQVTPKSMAA